MSTTSKVLDELKDLLLWKKCIFMTFDQYKTKRTHINENIYYNEAYTDNIKKYVIEHIKSLAGSLPLKKVPKPIYVLACKHIEFDESDSILPTDCKVAYEDLLNGTINYNNLQQSFEKDKTISRYQNYNISCFKNNKDELFTKNSEEIIKYKFIYDNIDNEKNKEEMKKSSLSSYKFKGLYEVIIYVPNINKSLQYFTSYQDFSYQNRWMDLIVDRNNGFLDIIPFQKDYEGDIIKMLGEDNYKKQKILFDKNIKILNDKDSFEYPLVKDLTNICYDLGCSSKYGEDLDEMIPKPSKTYDEQINNAKAKGPYFPTKCLKTKYYEDHMINLKTASDMKDYKDGVKEKLLENINSFKVNYEKINTGETPNEYSSTNVIDVIKGSATMFRNEKYKDDGKKNYSKEYNRKILSELAFRHNTVPGVQEITIPAFRLNDDFKELTQYTHFMPWGNILLDNKYVLNDGDILEIENTYLTSFNGIYELKLDDSSKLSLFKNKMLNRVIIDVSFAKFKNIKVVFENGSINMYGYDKNGNNDNRYGMYVSSNTAISPLSIVIDNNGEIVVYGNGFNVIKKI